MPRGEKSSRPSKGFSQPTKSPQYAPSRPHTPSTSPPASPPPKREPSDLKKPSSSVVGKTNQSLPSRPSRFREMAEIAGAATVGSTIGHVIGSSITGVFQRIFGSSQSTSNAPNNQKNECEFEMSKFLECYNAHKAETENLQNCDELFDRLRECKAFYQSAK